MSTDKASYNPVATADVDLEQNLVGPAAGSTLPTAAATPLVQVVAPATLPEGYEFDAIVGDNRTIKVQVPPGGVEEGQRFSVPLPQAIASHISGISVPVGHWRDGLFECFHYGVCHPHCWTSFCCPLIAAGQVIRRLHLNWYGGVGNGREAQSILAFRILFAITAMFWTIHLIFFLTGQYEIFEAFQAQERGDIAEEQEDIGKYNDIVSVDNLQNWIYTIISVALLWKVRHYVRSRYAIPGSPIEDCCCSWWCHCCVAAQMLRHTTDYDTYPSLCCTETGIPPTAPSIV